MGVDLTADAVELPIRRRAVAAAVVAMRPHQWTKNLLLFGGIVFAAKIGDAHRWLEAIAAFAMYCAVSSSAYLVNDVRDRDADRVHPVKRFRPVARGEISPQAALGLAGTLLAGAIVLAILLGPSSVGLLAIFVAVQVAYTMQLKHVVLIDVLSISALFVVRAAAGAEAVRVPISPWLFLCTGLLALFLALGKRRGELVLVQAHETPGRRVLDGYTLAVIDQLVTIVAAATIVAYALYTFTARDSHTLMITIPYVVFGVFRYVLLLNRQIGEEPDRVLVTDLPILADVAAWAVTCAVILVAG